MRRALRRRRCALHHLPPVVARRAGLAPAREAGGDGAVRIGHAFLRGLLLILIGWNVVTPALAAAPDDYPVAHIEQDFACGGVMEANAWNLWDLFGEPWLQDEWVARVLQRDAYALYEMQSYDQNIVAMAYRCRRFARLQAMAVTLMPVYDALQPVDIDGGLNGPLDWIGWICGSGSTCPASHDREVLLVSVQGLGFLTGVARYMVESSDPTIRNDPFVASTVEVAIQHALRWTQAENLSFFYDKAMWLETILGNIFGIARIRPELFAEVPAVDQQVMRDKLQELMDEHAAATDLTQVSSPWLGGTVLAADTGTDPFWSTYHSTQWASYEGDREHPPVDCSLLPGDPVVVPRAPAASLGWDFSHASRLVPAMVGLEINAAALQELGVGNSMLATPQITRQYAAQVVARIWNGDTDRPLFSNFWNGVNGWTNVVAPPYGCASGWWPSFYSAAFAGSSGYAQWGDFYPVLTQLARNIYWMSQSGAESDEIFIGQWYARLSKPAAGSNTRLIGLMGFWPALVRSDVLFANDFER